MNLKRKIIFGSKAFFKIDNFGDFLLDYYKIKKGYLIYKIGNKKIKVRAGTQDIRVIMKHLLTHQYYPPWLKLNKDSVVVDIGAHIGIFPILINAGKVYAIEPDRENFNLLLEQIKINNSINIVPCNLAISDKTGSANFYINKHNLAHSLLNNKTELKDCSLVKTITLKDFFNKEKIERCDLLKIDVEGAEYNILYSTKKDTFDRINKIFIELHDIKGQDKMEMLNFLNKQGFKIHAIRNFSFVYAIKETGSFLSFQNNKF